MFFFLSSPALEAATACFLKFEAWIKKKEDVWILIWFYCIFFLQSFAHPLKSNYSSIPNPFFPQ